MGGSYNPEKARKRKESLLAKGFCPLCGQGKREKGRSRCLVCLFKARGRTARRIARLRRQGLCACCGRNPARVLTKCLECRLRKSVCDKQKLDKKRVNGICLFCDEKAQKGLRLCEKHHKKFYRNQARSVKRRKKRNKMSEALIVRNIIAGVKKRYPNAYVRKLAERFNRGMPDILIIFKRHCFNEHFIAGTLFVETKAKGGRMSPIQHAEHEKIRRVEAAGCDVVIARDTETVLHKLLDMGACS